MTLKITALLENQVFESYKGSLIGKPGLSLFIQDNKHTILFDTGPDRSFIDNAKKLNIDLSSVTTVIISHGHFDHCGGLGFLSSDAKLIAHPDVKNERYYGWAVTKNTAIRLKKISKDVDFDKFDAFFSKDEMHISERFLYSGEIKKNENKQYGIIINNDGDEKYSPDFVKDEGVLIYKSTKGLIIFIGCGHRGVIDIIEYAKKITGIEKVYAVIGGLHLRRASPFKLLEVRKYIKKENISHIYACHCSGAWGRLWLPNAKNLSTGQSIEFD
ncbi:MBL fold metallo-hydrolase [Xenorhabdus szentirmaii]|uniref:Metallo-beta-lactamase domain-containing protein n=2 Tax=Xenorhabdus szentirmaii TaxID=290112 RepID=W1IWM3_9GAMM|nr:MULTISPECIES: MBL fold metallo-hydrolase [Xenorhabdus]MBD2792384.1 MBL fold metallo-hydrolase [Xenorhabdus sp. CUL]MBD2802233.1 MBL fold metallo-hydrolase [Xenorhabdus sp. M]MBD2805860.1 MBL fold metallo-hydrolase [Xenorhabdus sp. ZM]MBD2825937.1 MBL fold metallo-hydrolase [Xenorhabdus sp. 5]PHM31491.1 Ribonuclease BN [Xenorhabdus szentirmaii DSM 16338]